ncbi:MAG: VWA domain-containing protein [Actinobacteria bacterium]|nr:VWA domain-containing protein [Actinomycetota bacterium]
MVYSPSPFLLWSHRDEMAEDPGRHAVVSDYFDRTAYASILADSPYIEDGIRANREAFRPFPQFLQDLFTLFFRHSIILREYHEVDSPFRFNLAMIGDFKSSEPFLEMHEVTVLNEHLSMLAAMIAAEEILNHIGEPEMREKEGMARAEEMLRETKINIELIEDLLHQAEDPRERERLNNLKQSLEEETERLRDGLRDLPGMDSQQERGIKVSEGSSERERAGFGMEEAMNRAFKEAARKFDQSSSEMVHWGTEPGEPIRLDATQRLDLALKMKDSDRLRQFFKMVGRFRMAAISAHNERMRHGVDEVYEIECGADLSHLIPAELSMLTNPLLKKDFFRRYHERRLLCYHLRHNDPGERGPMVVLVDVSDSMGGEKELWAKAVALALRELAWRKRRHCAVVEFGARDDPLLVLRFPPGVERVDDVVRMAEFFLGGGTDFVKPLEAALAILQTKDYREADVVMITDGDCPLERSWVDALKREKKRLGFNHYTIITDVGHSTTRYVNMFSDEIIRVSDLTVQGANSVLMSLPF